MEEEERMREGVEEQGAAAAATVAAPGVRAGSRRWERREA